MGRGRFTRVVAVFVAGGLSLATVTAFAGCGGKSGSSATTGATQAAPPSKARVQAMQRQLENAVITSKAIGSGWQVARPADVRPVSEWCDRPLAGGVQPYAQTTAAFKTRFGSAVTQDLQAYAGDGAQRVLDDFRKIVTACPSWETNPELGRTTKYTLTRVKAARLGDDSVATRIHFSNSFGGIEVDHSAVAVMIRRGAVIDLLTQTANAGLFQGKGETLRLARLADRRMTPAG